MPVSILRFLEPDAAVCGESGAPAILDVEGILKGLAARREANSDKTNRVFAKPTYRRLQAISLLKRN